jgi:O-acetyl-ADP-ribose deacetylase (regulator of RNase III)
VLELVRGNIVEQTTDAIVNAANTTLLGAAASMVRSIARAVRRFWRSAGGSVGAPRATLRSRPADGFPHAG